MRSMKFFLILVVLVSNLGACTTGSPRKSAKHEKISVRATELNQEFWNSFKDGKYDELLVEFRQGDQLPLTLQAKGDLVETNDAKPFFLNVKENFFLKLSSHGIEMSFDGTHFESARDLLNGSFTVSQGALTSNESANAINMVMEALLK